MPELRLVVLALQDKLAYGPSFESAMTALFGGGAPALAAPLPAAAVTSAAPPASPAPAAPGGAGDTGALITEAARDLADYQRLTAEGRLGEAGQKLEALKRVLDQLQQRR
jgi:hypothetical protein